MVFKYFFKYFLLITSMFLTILILSSFFHYIRVSSETAINDSVKGTSVYLAQVTCEPPVEGCGSSHYWDFSTCSCVYDGSCVEPVPGCGTDYYWDHYECVCKPYDGGTICQEPINGCGTGFIWDSSACTCIYIATCTEPTGGCGIDYVWDSANCQCEYVGTTCTEPSGGCESNYYWDTSSCSCVYYQNTCSEPSGGCEDGYFWDSASCACKSDSSTTYCTTSTPCSDGEYWDYILCECQSDTSGTMTTYLPTPTSTTTNYMETISSFDRLAYETEPIITCIKNKLTSTEYQAFRYQIAETEVERQFIYSLSDKVRFCWTQYADFNSGIAQEAMSSTKNSLENEECLIKLIGQASYKDIYDGRREPTERERLAFKSCYQTKVVRTVTLKSDEEELDDTVQQCLKLALGIDEYGKIIEGKVQPISAQLTKINTCFGTIAQPFDEGSTYKAPEKVVSCLQSALSVVAFEQINSGGRVPTTEEIESGKFCFNGINSVQKKFLPPTVEEVPFLDEDSELVKVAVANQVKKKEKNKEVGGAIVLSGNGPPNSTVNIYIYSDPIVVTTETDENGDWIYELKNPIDGEKHIAYATVRNEDGRIVRSSVFDFTVVAADTESIQPLLEESKASDAQDKFIKAATIMVGTASVIVIIIGIIIYLKNAKLLKEAADKASSGSAFESNDRKSKGNSSSGSVN